MSQSQLSAFNIQDIIKEINRFFSEDCSLFSYSLFRRVINKKKRNFYDMQIPPEGADLCSFLRLSAESLERYKVNKLKRNIGSITIEKGNVKRISDNREIEGEYESVEIIMPYSLLLVKTHPPSLNPRCFRTTAVEVFYPEEKQTKRYRIDEIIEIFPWKTANLINELPDYIFWKDLKPDTR